MTVVNILREVILMRDVYTFRLMHHFHSDGTDIT